MKTKITIIALSVTTVLGIAYGIITASLVVKQNQINSLNKKIDSIENLISKEQLSYEKCVNDIMPNAHKKADELRAEKAGLEKQLLDFIQE